MLHFAIIRRFVLHFHIDCCFLTLEDFELMLLFTFAHFFKSLIRRNVVMLKLVYANLVLEKRHTQKENCLKIMERLHCLVRSHFVLNCLFVVNCPSATAIMIGFICCIACQIQVDFNSRTAINDLDDGLVCEVYARNDTSV